MKYSAYFCKAYLNSAKRQKKKKMKITSSKLKTFADEDLNMAGVLKSSSEKEDIAEREKMVSKASFIGIFKH